MIGEENTVDELRELIALPPRIEWALRAYAQARPEEAHFTPELHQMGPAA